MLNTLTLKLLIKDIPLLSKVSVSEIKNQQLAGLTNNNYLLKTTNENYILRIPRVETNESIDRNHEAYNADIAYQLGLAPKVIWREKDNNCFTGLSLTTVIENTETLTSTDLKDSRILGWLAEVIKDLQSSQYEFKGLLDSHNIAKHLNAYFYQCNVAQQKELQSDLKKALELLKMVNQCDQTLVPSHIDLVAENMLKTKDKLWIIDWEYSSMASPFWDIATICNEGNLDDKEAKGFLAAVMTGANNNDFENLKKYQTIVSAISKLWCAAYTENSDCN